MSANGGPTLDAQLNALRGQLRTQRHELALQLLAPKARGAFPRSSTMRFLVRQPELVGWLVARIAGPRVGLPVAALLLALGRVEAGKSRPFHVTQ